MGKFPATWLVGTLDHWHRCEAYPTNEPEEHMSKRGEGSRDGKSEPQATGHEHRHHASRASAFGLTSNHAAISTHQPTIPLQLSTSPAYPRCIPTATAAARGGKKFIMKRSPGTSHQPHITPILSFTTTCVDSPRLCYPSTRTLCKVPVAATETVPANRK